MNPFIEKGREILSEALALENKKDYQQALDKYYLGIKHFMTGLKYIEGKKTKEQVKKYINEYLEKAEQIKELLHGKTSNSSSTGAATGGDATAGINTSSLSSASGSSKTTTITTTTATTTACPRSSGNSRRKSASMISNQTNEKKNQQAMEEVESLQNAIRLCVVNTKEEKIPWNEVIGMDSPKETINEALLLPRQFPQLFVGERKPIRTILLYGPPGTGKSFFVKAVASNMENTTFFSVSSSDIVSKYMGESEKLVKTLFEEAKKRQPSIIFIDEIDAVGSSREGLGGGSSNESISRLKTELLLKVQEVLDMKETGVIVIGATNRPTDLDPALRRRFQKRIYIPLPDENARKQLFRINLEGVDVEITQQDIDEFAKLTNQYSGADIGIIVRDALMKPVREAMNSDYFKTTNDGTIIPCSRNEKNSKMMNMLDIQKPEKLKVGKVSAKDIYDSIKSVKPSTNPSEILSFIEFTQNYGEIENSVSISENEQESNDNQHKRKKSQDTEQEIGSVTVQKPKRKKYL